MLSINYVSQKCIFFLSGLVIMIIGLFINHSFFNYLSSVDMGYLNKHIYNLPDYFYQGA